MSKLRLTLTLLLSLSLSLLAWAPSHAENVVGPTNAILCSKTASATPTSATTTALVSGVAGQSIYICGWHVTSILNTTSTFQFEYGTQGGPCGNSPIPTTVITPAFNVTSTAPSADHITYAVLQVPAGAQLCIVTGSGTTGDAVLVYYSQF